LQTNYVLIDFENVQPKNLAVLAEHNFRVYLFVGANQTKLSFDLASAMQELGEKASYIKISGNGPNALDFHIAYYVGEISQKDPGAYFHIISKDTGFDPLIQHLKKGGLKIHRERDIGEIPVLKVSSSTTDTEKLEAVIKNLSGRGQSKPRKLKTLANTINSIFTEKLSDQELADLIDQMTSTGKILVKDGNVSYRLNS
jgi:hypothetical protein